MSTNAGTWFYTEPEHRAYLIAERVNGTFWQARVTTVYWHCVRAEPPFRVEGYADGAVVEMEWEPDRWLALKAPDGFDPAPLVKALSRRILTMPAALTYTDPAGRQVYEWHTDGGEARWKAIQGRGGFGQPHRLRTRQEWV